MEIDKQDILQKIRKIYFYEIALFEEDEIDDHSELWKMAGINVASDDVSFFSKAVLEAFKIPFSQSDWNSIYTLKDVANFVVKKLEEKQTP